MTFIRKNACSALIAVCVFSLPISANAEELIYGFQAEEFEYRAGENGEDLLVWEVDALVGSDELKLRLESSAEFDLDAKNFEDLSNQITLQTPISDFWDVKGGIRADTPEGSNRWYGVVGITGLAPQWIEVDADLYFNNKGDLSVSFDAEYELLITNYLILTPSAQIEAAFSSDEEVGVGSGINSAEIGLRLSYDILDRAISPYVGVVYERKFGQTANFARDEGEETSSWQAVIGTKLLF
ncbi:copper resistance protein CopB [Alphaproteobacteria bacterium 46_93_T64]|nr:copper resistance protein CopB [Alphaproteobacteria bacterium 46_93_T64]